MTVTITIPLLPTLLGITCYFLLAIYSRADEWGMEFLALILGAIVFFMSLGIQTVLLGG